jgi:hypothetical protein
MSWYEMRDRPVEQSIDQMTASACDMSGGAGSDWRGLCLWHGQP